MEQTSSPLAVVTGATGFIGSHVVDALLSRGWRVRVLAREKSDLKWLPEHEIDVARGSLLDPVFLKAHLAGAAAVFHVAGTYRAPSLEAFRQANVLPGRRMLETLVEIAREAGVSRSETRFVFVSSFAAAGPSPDGTPLTEADPCRPVSDYGRSKLEAEEVVLSFRDRVPVTVARPPGVYGPRDPNFIVVFKQVERGLVPKVGRKERRANLVYGPDFAEALIRIAGSDVTEGQVYFVANEALTGNVELVEEVAAILGKRVRRILVPMFLFDVFAVLMRWKKRLTGTVGFVNEDRIATMRQPYWVASVEKLKRDVQWVPSTPLREGLEVTAGWYREQGWL